MYNWYYDFNDDRILSRNALRESYENDMTDEDRHGRTFEEVVRDCCDGNGTLSPIPDERNGRDYVLRYNGRLFTYDEMLRHADEYFPGDPVQMHFRKIELN